MIGKLATWHILPEAFLVRSIQSVAQIGDITSEKDHKPENFERKL